MTKTFKKVVRRYLTTEMISIQSISVSSTNLLFGKCRSRWKFKISQHQRNDDNQMREKYVTSLTWSSLTKNR